MLNNKVSKAVRLAIAFGAVSTAAFSASSFAAEDEGVEKVERIEVTGSAIKRTDLEGALPVTVLSTADIERTGVDNVADLMQQLPSMQGFTTPSDSVGGGGGGIATASIHDLGAQYTLVLLNGRRLAPRGSGSTIDLNSIPLSAIKRVEVLKDGAGALYGSDAIAGVVNFILKDDVDETTITGRVSKTQEGGGDSWNGSITTGFGDFDKDGFSVVLSYSHDEKDRLAAVDRDFAKTGIIEFENNNRNLYFFNGSPNAIPGNAQVNYADGTVHQFNPYQEQNGQCAEDNSPVGDWCFFDYTTTIEIQPESSRDSFMVNSKFSVTDDIEAFVEGSYSDYSMTTRIAPYPSGGIPIPVGSPLYNQYLEPNLLDGYTSADVSSALGVWRALPAGNRTTEWNTKSTHFVVGVEGIIADEIDFETAFTYSKNDTDQNYPTGWLIGSKVGGAVASGEIDIFAPQGTVTSEEVANSGIVYSGPWSNSSTEMKGLDAKASMPLFELSGGEVYIAYGADYRTYDFDNTLSPANQDSIILFLSADTPYSFSRNVWGAFTELVMPVLDNLEVSASLRYDDVGSVEDNLNQVTVNDGDSDTTYKLTAKWQATDDLLIRGSYGTGFKAPSMLDIGQPRAEFGVTSDTYVCPFEGTGDPKEAWCKPGRSQYNVYTQGNPNLKAETSKQYTVGFFYAPNGDFSFGMDYWAVDMENLVTSLTEGQIFQDSERYYDLFSYKTNVLTGVDELAIVQASVNVGSSETSGIDWDLNKKVDLDIGTFRLGWTGTYMIESQYTRPGTTDDWITSMGQFGDNNAVTFRVVSQLQLGLELGDFYNNFTVNYRSGYMDQFQSASKCSVTVEDALGDCADVQLEISSYTKVDYQTKYDITDQAAVTFGINNLFDVAPDLSLRTGGAGHQVGYDPRYTDSYGRTFYLSGQYKF